MSVGVWMGHLGYYVMISDVMWQMLVWNRLYWCQSNSNSQISYNGHGIVFHLNNSLDVDKELKPIIAKHEFIFSWKKGFLMEFRSYEVTPVIAVTAVRLLHIVSLNTLNDRNLIFIWQWKCVTFWWRHPHILWLK